MAKKQTEIENKSQLFEMSVEEVMHTSMMPYSEYVILDRAHYTPATNYLFSCIL